MKPFRRALFLFAIPAGLGVVACGDASGPTTAGPLATLDIASGNEQTGVVGKELSAPIEVAAKDASVNVNWFASSTALAVSGGHTFTSIASFAQGACGLTASQTIYCWGKGFGTTPVLVTP